MKRFCICFVAILCLFCLLNAYAAEIDGIDSGYEWDGLQPYVLISGESNCGVNFGTMKLKFDNENRAVFFCFMLKDPKLKKDNMNAGISLSIEDSEPFVITASSSPIEYDIDKISFSGAMSVDENNGATCEIRIGMKAGVPRELNGTVRFIDSDGKLSNTYDFSIKNDSYIEPTAIGESSGVIYKTNKYETKKNTTRKSRTEKSTANKYTTVEFKINNSPPYSYTGKLKPTTEKKKTTTVKEKTTAQPKTKKPATKPAGATVYYYEKEVIISQVYITEPITHKIETTAEAETQTTEQTTKTVSLSKGRKLKIATAVTAGVLLFALAAWGAIGAKKKPDSQINNE